MRPNAAISAAKANKQMPHPDIGDNPVGAPEHTQGF
jgi:hypothetical protein